MTPQAFTDYLHASIPLTAALQARVLRCADDEVEIAAPFAPNRNHRSTVFGGSLATLGILSGWAVLHLALSREKLAARLVVQKSASDFSAPVTGEFRAVSRLPGADWPKFVATLARRKRARITVQSEIRAGEAVAMVHDGTYVAVAEGAA